MKTAKIILKSGAFIREVRAGDMFQVLCMKKDPFYYSLTNGGEISISPDAFSILDTYTFRGYAREGTDILVYYTQEKSMNEESLSMSAIIDLKNGLFARKLL